jgi:peptidoglycan/LPS O-acetylase OafA/YrhL
MKKRKSFLTAFNLIVAAAVACFGIMLYSVHTFDWFLILWPIIPVILLMVAVAYMPNDDASV